MTRMQEVSLVYFQEEKKKVYIQWSPTPWRWVNEGEFILGVFQRNGFDRANTPEEMTVDGNLLDSSRMEGIPLLPECFGHLIFSNEVRNPWSPFVGIGNPIQGITGNNGWDGHVKTRLGWVLAKLTVFVHKILSSFRLMAGCDGSMAVGRRGFTYPEWLLHRDRRMRVIMVLMSWVRVKSTLRSTAQQPSDWRCWPPWEKHDELDGQSLVELCRRLRSSWRVSVSRFPPNTWIATKNHVTSKMGGSRDIRSVPHLHHHFVVYSAQSTVKDQKKGDVT